MPVYQTFRKSLDGDVSCGSVAKKKKKFPVTKIDVNSCENDLFTPDNSGQFVFPGKRAIWVLQNWSFFMRDLKKNGESRTQIVRIHAVGLILPSDDIPVPAMPHWHSQ